MIRFLAALLLLLLLSVPVVAESKVLDLKTHLVDKLALSPVKVGASYWLLKSGYQLLDVGEDYAVWLTDYQSTKESGTVRVSLTVKITPTSGLTEKKSLISQVVTYNFPVSPPKVTDTDEAATVFLREKLERKTDLAITEGSIGGKAVANAILTLLGRL